MKAKNRVKGILPVAFGVGLLFSLACPTHLLVTILAIAIVVLGVALLRSC